MAGPSPSRRPGAGSRNPTSRPRRVAGTGGGAGRVAGGEDEAPTPVPQDEVESATSTPEPTPASEPDPDPHREDEPVTRARPGRRVLALVALVVVLLGVGIAELVVITGHVSPQDRPAEPVSAARPVQVDELTVRSVVDQAAQATVAIGSVSWEDYEAGVDEAAAMMTEAFAETFRETKEDVKEQVVDQQVEVTVQVDAQGVVRADENEVVALVFLTQSTIAGTGPVTPRQYRATVTMVRTPDGWLAADLDAGDLLDITGDDG